MACRLNGVNHAMACLPDLYDIRRVYAKYLRDFIAQCPLVDIRSTFDELLDLADFVILQRVYQWIWLESRRQAEEAGRLDKYGPVLWPQSMEVRDGENVGALAGLATWIRGKGIYKILEYWNVHFWIGR